MKTATEVRDAGPEDNAALVELAAQCPMEGDMSLCVQRRPDFFALSRLEGDPWKVGVVDGADGPIACVGVARRRVYLDGRPAYVAYVGDLKVHPEYRRHGVARMLVRWAWSVAADMVGPDGLGLGTVLAGNTAVEKLMGSVAAGGPTATPLGTIRSHSISLLWRRRLPRTGLTVRRAGPGDVAGMADLWRRVAATRQFAPVYDAASLARWIDTAPGLCVGDYLVAHRPDGELAGFLGLWDQSGFKQMLVTGYSPRLAAVRAVLNVLAPRASRLPAAGGELRYRSVVNPCAADAATLRALLLHACDRLRGDYSFFTIGLDTRDPLTRALRGLYAQPTDVTVLAGRADGNSASLDDRPLHFEIATV